MGGGSFAQGDSIASTFAGHGNLAGFLLVLVGGLLLNLTPCVYPMLGVTVAYFGVEGSGAGRVVRMALLYVLGIALSFSALGVAAAWSGGLFGAALQNPFVLGALAVMLLVLAASSFGLFTLQPPQWMMRRVGVARPGYVGSLIMGLGMGVVAAPCIGPIVLGLLLMVERSGSALFGFALFFTLAIGMGLPYVALAVAAGNIRKLPRSGEWLAWIEQLFGFVLVGLALYFVDPLTPNRLMTRALPFYAAAAGILLGFVSPKGRNWPPFLIVKSALGVASTAALIYLLIRPNAPAQQLLFRPYDAGLLAGAQARRAPVVIDFSADWCVPCREMERTTFTDHQVIKRAAGFVLMRANLTAANAQDQALMKQFNVQGVPTTLFLDGAGRVREHRVGYIGPRDFLKYLQESN
jgi:thiol:disulfide interchange protein DsbD